MYEWNLAIIHNYCGMPLIVKCTAILMQVIFKLFYMYLYFVFYFCTFVSLYCACIIFAFLLNHFDKKAILHWTSLSGPFNLLLHWVDV